jgi:hypothetical protein
MRERNRQSNSGTAACDLKTLRAGVGMDGAVTGDSVAERADTAHPVSHARAGDAVVARAAAASSGDGGLRALDWPAPGERHGAVVGPSGLEPPPGVGASGPGQGQEGHWCGR